MYLVCTYCRHNRVVSPIDPSITLLSFVEMEGVRVASVADGHEALAASVALAEGPDPPSAGLELRRRRFAFGD